MSYTYENLEPGFIRVLEILPSSRSSKHINCRIRIVPFGSIDYDAVSYCWGAPKITKSIFIQRKRLRIRTNIFHFLKLLAAQRYRGQLWIDAICINQDDVTEKNHQVKAMGKIYSQARCVKVWLGRSVCTSPKSVRCLIDSMQQSRLIAPDVIAGTPMEPTAESAEWRNHCKAVEQILDCDYWSRIWIVQELYLARQKTLHFNTVTVDWEVFIACIYYVEPLLLTLGLQFQLMAKYGATRLPMALRGRREHARKLFLEDEINTFGHSDCHDARDRVYALVNMFPEQNKDFPIDYAKNPFEVHIDVMYRYSYHRKFAIKFSQHLYYLLVNKDVLTSFKGMQTARSYCAELAPKAGPLYLNQVYTGVDTIDWISEDLYSPEAGGFLWSRAKLEKRSGGKPSFFEKEGCMTALCDDSVLKLTSNAGTGPYLERYDLNFKLFHTKANMVGFACSKVKVGNTVIQLGSCSIALVVDPVPTSDPISKTDVVSRATMFFPDGTPDNGPLLANKKRAYTGHGGYVKITALNLLFFSYGGWTQGIHGVLASSLMHGNVRRPRIVIAPFDTG